MTLSSDAKNRVLDEVAAIANAGAIRSKLTPEQQLEELKDLKAKVKQHLAK
jgi:hypothetical protein